jgi:hypothetical protein
MLAEVRHIFTDVSFILAGFLVASRSDRNEGVTFENPGLHEAGAAEGCTAQAQ